MSITSLVATRIEFAQRGWSLGYCTDCQGDSPIRIEESFGTQSIGHRVIKKAHFGDYARCDFCECILKDLRSQFIVDMNSWHRGDSLEYLAELLGISGPFTPGNSYQRHYAVLWQIQWTTKVKELDIRSDLYLGCLIGILVGAAVGGSVAWHFPQFALQLLGIGSFTGLVAGGAGASLISVQLQQSRLAFSKLLAAYQRYPLDCDLLRSIARNQNMDRRMQRLVCRFADDVAIGKMHLR